MSQDNRPVPFLAYSMFNFLGSKDESGILPNEHDNFSA